MNARDQPQARVPVGLFTPARPAWPPAAAPFVHQEAYWSPWWTEALRDRVHVEVFATETEALWGKAAKRDFSGMVTARCPTAA